MRFVQVVITVILSIIACHNVYAKTLPSGTDCNRHPLQCAIQTLQPTLAGAEARLLSNLIHKYSKKYNVDPYRVIAIAMQESGLKNIDRSHNNIITDIGIYQFNIGTIDIYGMDANRLKTDIAYATERMCWLLSTKLKDCRDLGTDAWACYHSRTDKHRTKYQKLVNRYYNKISADVLAEVNDVK